MTLQSQPMQALTSAEHVNWYTPPKYIEMARTVMGSISLDPASCAVAQSWINAKQYYGLDNALNGLQEGWYSNVWCNPPFDNTALWLQWFYKQIAMSTINQAILLVNSNHGYKWYEQLWRTFPVCCVEKRIEFITDYNPVEIMYGTATPYYINTYTLQTKGQAKRGQTFAYYGDNVAAFYNIFKTIGRVIIPKKG